jgi:hypothetical protein
MGKHPHSPLSFPLYPSRDISLTWNKNSDTTGYGWHGDFLNGWDTELLRAAIDDKDTCGDSAGGVIDRCAPFQPYLLTGDQQMACPAIPSRIDKQVDGVLAALPGAHAVASTVVVSVAAPTANAAGRRLRRAWA